MQWLAEWSVTVVRGGARHALSRAMEAPWLSPLAASTPLCAGPIDVLLFVGSLPAQLSALPITGEHARWQHSFRL